VSLASAMLAGVLLRFGLDVFVAIQRQLVMALAMFAVYLLGRRVFPRYAVIATLAVGIAITACSGMLHLETAQLRLARPAFVWPTLSWQALFGIALPLFVMTMASQNLPGVAVIRASGYAVPTISPAIGWIGVVNTLLAPFGAYGLNLAAITAAICMGREAQEDPQRRYMASVFAGLFYLLIGLFGATVAALFAAFPKELVIAIAGIALFGTIGNSLAAALFEIELAMHHGPGFDAQRQGHVGGTPLRQQAGDALCFRDGCIAVVQFAPDQVGDLALVQRGEGVVDEGQPAGPAVAAALDDRHRFAQPRQ